MPWWAEVVRGTDVQLYIGQADYKSGDPAHGPYWQDPREMSDHLTLNRSYPEVPGNVHFSAVQVRANRLGATDIYAAEHYSRPGAGADHAPPAGQAAALPGGHQGDPAGRRGPAAPGGSRPTASARSAPPPRTRSTGSTAPQLPGRCGIADAAHLVDTVRATPGNAQSWVDTSAEPGRRYTYQLTALDRSANESPASPPAFVLR